MDGSHHSERNHGRFREKPRIETASAIPHQSNAPVTPGKGQPPPLILQEIPSAIRLLARQLE
jgi:hypothetical protein